MQASTRISFERYRGVKNDRQTHLVVEKQSFELGDLFKVLGGCVGLTKHLEGYVYEIVIRLYCRW